MAMGMKVQRKLDPKQCFEIWGRGISTYKIPLVLKNEFGLYNEKNGKPYSHQGCYLACGNYILEHLNEPETREIFNNVWKTNHQIATDADWYKFVASKAKYLTPKKYNKFMEVHKYLIPFLPQNLNVPEIQG